MSFPPCPEKQMFFGRISGQRQKGKEFLDRAVLEIVSFPLHCEPPHLKYTTLFPTQLLIKPQGCYYREKRVVPNFGRESKD